MFVAVLRRSLLCACSLAIALGVTQARADALQDARSAYEAKVDGDLDESIRLYSKAIDTGELTRENLAVAFNNRGIAYRAKDLQDLAIEDYDTAIMLMPEYSFAYYNRGLARYSKGLYDAAIGDFDMVLRLEPDDAEVINNRGVARHGKGEFERAIADYDAALAIDPGYAYAYYNRGNANRALGRYTLAVDDYDRTIELDPNDVEAYGSRGNTKFYLRWFSSAVQDFEHLLAADQDDLYRAIWRYLSLARNGEDGAEPAGALRGVADGLDHAAWPGRIADLYLGRADAAEVIAPAKAIDRAAGREHECEAYFYVGQYHLIRGERDAAERASELAVETGASHFIEFAGAKAELAHVNGAN